MSVSDAFLANDPAALVDVLSRVEPDPTTIAAAGRLLHKMGPRGRQAIESLDDRKLASGLLRAMKR